MAIRHLITHADKFDAYKYNLEAMASVSLRKDGDDSFQLIIDDGMEEDWIQLSKDELVSIQNRIEKTIDSDDFKKEEHSWNQ